MKISAFVNTHEKFSTKKNNQNDEPNILPQNNKSECHPASKGRLFPEESLNGRGPKLGGSPEESLDRRR